MSILLRRKTKLIASAIAQMKSTQCHYRISHIPVRCLSQKVVHLTWSKRTYCNTPKTDPVGTALLDLVIYEAACSDTLEGLCEYFDDLVESTPHLKSADVNYSVRILLFSLIRTLIQSNVF